ncbi:STAS domain-containing protein [Massilia sp. R2A-15]|uniref:STAS domain-containing protein n=1 Tax=Massilia sp. R2A-15 TaxID=3064278 RepID=UPI002732E8DA|nr:STAS domain-containing protein [Massilia sp. R2A-15]WLI91193.1 STAS domain-containing protein [Massilia sp. R2A-15]
MTTIDNAARISTLISQNEPAILADWIANLNTVMVRNDASADEQLRRHCSQFLGLFSQAASKGGVEDIDHRAWDDVRNLLTEISASRARQGSTPSETATFVFSLKQSLFTVMGKELSAQPEELAAALWSLSTLIDKLGLFTMEVFQKSRDQIIVRQQQELLELSTPVVKLWQDILALPLIGTLDSARTQVVMESLLQKIVETGAAIAIIDITGVPTVDTLVAQHLMKTIAAARLMGADCIISGIRPQIAQTIVHLGVNLEDVITKATLADAFVIALGRVGASISRG